MSNITSEADKAFNRILSENAIPQDTSVSLNTPMNNREPIQNNAKDLSDLMLRLNQDNLNIQKQEEERQEAERLQAIREEEKRLKEEKDKALAQKAKEEEKLRQNINEEVNRLVKEKEEELRKSIAAENKPRFPFFRGKKDKKQPLVEEIKVESVNTPKIPLDSPDLARLAYMDEKFSINNANAYKRRLNELGDTPTDIIIINIDANNLKYVNDNFGHTEGDKFLKIIADTLRDFFKDENTYRQGGDEFCAIIPIEDNTPEGFEYKLKELSTLLTSKEKEFSLLYPVSVSTGFAFADGKTSLEDLIQSADKKMYEAKSEYHEKHPEYDMRGTVNLPFTNLTMTPVFTFSDIQDYLIINKDDIYTIFLCDKDGSSLWIFQDIDICFDMLNDMEIERSAIGFCLIVTDKEYKFFGDDIDDVISIKPIIKASKSRITEKDLFLKFKQEIAYFDNVYI